MVQADRRRDRGDPERRHRNATIGHATSTDLRKWTEHAVLTPGGPGAIDATTTWTGSIVRADDGTWRMFYTAATFLHDEGNTNLDITAAISDDLYTWRKDPHVHITADPRWYEKLGDSDWPEEPWRDPWVYRHNNLWHMLITGRAKSGELLDRGVATHATSPDLTTWTVQPPLTSPGAGFAHLEVLQHVDLGGQQFVLFSAHLSTLTKKRQQAGDDTGTWIAPANPEIRLEQAINLTVPRLYSGRIIDLDGTPVLLAFRLSDDTGAFPGGIIDPLAVTVNDGRPTLVDATK